MRTDTEKRDRLLDSFRRRPHVLGAEVDVAKQTVRVRVVSDYSGTKSTLTLPLAGLLGWLDRQLIQVALPDLSDDDRELLLTGYTPGDWEEMFPDEEPF